MADENTNLNEEEQNENEGGTSNSQTDPATESGDTKSIVHDGVATFTIDGVSTNVPLQEGMVGCFANGNYTINDTGILKSKQIPGSYGSSIWTCKIGGVEYWFNDKGHCTIDADNVETHHLYIVASSIVVAEGSTVKGTTRGTAIGTKIVKVDSLTVRDQFAMIALEALIHRMDDPIECSNASVRYVTDKAYVFANSMMISSANARAAAGEDEPSGDSPGTVEVDANTLENNTEKLLNNIHKAIEAFRTTIQEEGVPVKGFKNEFNSNTFTKDVQAKVTNIDKVKFDGTPTIAISGIPNVNVNNMPSQPISVTGTVSVDNFPQSE